ncbi:hypothetical protein RclHR1_15970007 [Rhizophagus clarus]|uniref:Integrase catalytic domain-containing protein n=1 Tax=Rhizophagus clarus TaxID=94130 RepID=A0A2Z6QGG4_9GLOM|nr:hypothetical protein RclHR1_15970007 [Rhizophagus clarus]
MSQSQILIDPNEAQRIEKNIILHGIYYHPTGYHPNPKSLRDACKKESHRFCLSECKNFLEDQESYQTNKTSLKYIPRVSKKYKALLNIIDCASRYKASVPLISKNSLKVAKAFRKVYGDQNNPLTWPKLLQCDNGREWMGETSRLMQDHDITIWVIGLYSHRGTAIVERFNQTLLKILYKIQYAVESISSDPELMRA